MVVVESASSAIVTWMPPDIHLWNGIITKYTVVYENLGAVQGNDEDETALEPFQTQTISIPRPGLPLVNSPDPHLVSLPLRQESVLIEELEEYHVYSFAVYMENAEGESGLSEPTTQNMPQAGIHNACSAIKIIQEHNFPLCVFMSVIELQLLSFPMDVLLCCYYL